MQDPLVAVVPVVDTDPLGLDLDVRVAAVNDAAADGAVVLLGVHGSALRASLSSRTTRSRFRA